MPLDVLPLGGSGCMYRDSTTRYAAGLARGVRGVRGMAAAAEAAGLVDGFVLKAGLEAAGL
eukprot:5109835-Pyramimonas_sp.AAC.1